MLLWIDRRLWIFGFVIPLGSGKLIRRDRPDGGNTGRNRAKAGLPDNRCSKCTSVLGRFEKDNVGGEQDARR